MSATEVGRWDLFDEEELAIIALGLAHIGATAPLVELQAIAARLMLEVSTRLGVDEMPGGEKILDDMRRTLAAYER